MKILSFGEVLWDVYPDQKFIGGAPFNFAAHLAKHGEEAYMLSCIGNDALGEDTLSALKGCGVQTDYIARSKEKETGKCLVTLDENAIPSYNLMQDVAYDYIDCDAIGSGFDVLYFGTLSLRSRYNLDSLCKLLEKQRFKEIFVDVNIRAPFYSAESVSFAVEHATILKISDEELQTVANLLSMDCTEDHSAFAHALQQRYANLKIIIITLGGEGAYCLDCRNGADYRCPSQKVTVASSVGAGDSFSAAFLHQYLRQAALPFCLEYASKVAGFVVSNYEAVPDYRPAEFLC